MKSLRLKAAIKTFLAANAKIVAPATLALYRHYLEDFLRTVGNRYVAAIAIADVVVWNPKYHPAGCVRRLFSWLTVEARVLQVNPLAGMKSGRPAGRMRILSRHEVDRLLRQSAPVFRRLLVALVETIARPREMRAVRWGDIRTSGSPAWSVDDLRAGRCFFRLTKFKGQSLRRDRTAVRNIPISRRFGRLLARLWRPSCSSAEPIFRNHLGKPWTHNAVRCRFRRLRAAAGVGVDVNGENAVAYSVRHTAATDAVGAGVKGLVLAELMGHSDVRMTQRYVHLRPDHLLEAMGRIEEFKSGCAAKNGLPGSLRTRPD